MTNGGQVLEFWRTIISTIFGSLYNFLCLFVPLIIYFLLRDIATFNKTVSNIKIYQSYNKD